MWDDGQVIILGLGTWENGDEPVVGISENSSYDWLPLVLINYRRIKASE
jgi:hypothetical protein